MNKFIKLSILTLGVLAMAGCSEGSTSSTPTTTSETPTTSVEPKYSLPTLTINTNCKYIAKQNSNEYISYKVGVNYVRSIHYIDGGTTSQSLACYKFDEASGKYAVYNTEQGVTFENFTDKSQWKQEIGRFVDASIAAGSEILVPSDSNQFKKKDTGEKVNVLYNGAKTDLSTVIYDEEQVGITAKYYWYTEGNKLSLPLKSVRSAISEETQVITEIDTRVTTFPQNIVLPD